MNFLSLVQRLALETGAELQANIDDVTVVPATAYGSSTEFSNRLITWIMQAWLEIQDDQTGPATWKFMRTGGTMDLTVGILSYDIRQAIEDDEGTDQYDLLLPWVAAVDSRYIWIVDGNTDPLTKNKCYYVPPEHFFGDRNRQTDARGTASEFSFDADGCIVLNVSPDRTGLYLEFDYRLREQTFAVNADEPTGLPLKYHMIIVYRALLDYAGFDETDLQYKRAERLYKKMMYKLRLDQTPEYTVPGGR